MQSLQNWFAGSAPDKEPASGPSVLSEWNKYSSGGGTGSGAAAAPANGNQADRLLASAEEGTSAVKSFIGSAVGMVSGAASSAVSK